MSSGGKSPTRGVQDGIVGKSRQHSLNEDDAVENGSTDLFFTLEGDERTVYIPP